MVVRTPQHPHPAAPRREGGKQERPDLLGMLVFFSGRKTNSGPSAWDCVDTVPSRGAELRLQHAAEQHRSGKGFPVGQLLKMANKFGRQNRLLKVIVTFYVR